MSGFFVIGTAHFDNGYTKDVEVFEEHLCESDEDTKNKFRFIFKFNKPNLKLKKIVWWDGTEEIVT